MIWLPCVESLSTSQGTDRVSDTRVTRFPKLSSLGFSWNWPSWEKPGKKKECQCQMLSAKQMIQQKQIAAIRVMLHPQSRLCVLPLICVSVAVCVCLWLSGRPFLGWCCSQILQYVVWALTFSVNREARCSIGASIMWRDVIHPLSVCKRCCGHETQASVSGERARVIAPGVFRQCSIYVQQQQSVRSRAAGRSTDSILEGSQGSTSWRSTKQRFEEVEAHR